MQAHVILLHFHVSLPLMILAFLPEIQTIKISEQWGQMHDEMLDLKEMSAEFFLFYRLAELYILPSGIHTAMSNPLKFYNHEKIAGLRSYMTKT